ncbi:cysteine hydrolase family protein [Vibrio salinus]|uniref:cysteine hydrolase family protein n=1 Tax=Vibrio salinus TaxID=2899784 RepID=UPI001E53A397|nr:isochorismatase family protein [Vibrio salinus]MCE0494273.1 isochorismatase family protein [Vibrio salinus]
MSSKVLLVIDPQNDYLANGAYPLWNVEKVLENIKQLICRAEELSVPVILVRHIAISEQAPFFKDGSFGAEICSDIRELSQHADVVIKHYADSFDETELNSVLKSYSADSLILFGMMTQNCVTHTALSKSAESFSVSVVADCCTTIDAMTHTIALNALSRRCKLINLQECLNTL